MSFYSTFCPIIRQNFSFLSIPLFLSQNKTGGHRMARIIDTEAKNLIGEKVKKLRKEKHMSQQQLSDRLETMAIYICRGSISRIEDGSRTVTDIELYGLSQVLATPIEDFFK